MAYVDASLRTSGTARRGRPRLYLVKQLPGEDPVLGAAAGQQRLRGRAVQDPHCDSEHTGL